MSRAMSFRFGSQTFRNAFYVFAIATAVSALLPSPSFEPGIAHSDKLQHFAIFALLGGLALVGFPGASKRLIVERLSFFGAVIEVLQSIPGLGRDCDPLDWAADTLGAALAVVVLARLLARPRARAE